MNPKVAQKTITTIILFYWIGGLVGCATPQWNNADPTRDWKHDLSECNFTTMKNVCTNLGASVTPNCTTTNGATHCQPTVTSASNACHEELQPTLRDDCLKDLGWVKTYP